MSTDDTRLRPYPAIGHTPTNSRPGSRFRTLGLNNDAQASLVMTKAFVRGSKIFNVGTTPLKVIDEAIGLRNFLYIRNVGPGIMTVDFGDDANANSAVYLAVNEQIMFDANQPQDYVSIYASAASLAAVMWSEV